MADESAPIRHTKPLVAGVDAAVEKIAAKAASGELKLAFLAASEAQALARTRLAQLRATIAARMAAAEPGREMADFARELTEAGVRIGKSRFHQMVKDGQALLRQQDHDTTGDGHPL